MKRARSFPLALATFVAAIALLTLLGMLSQSQPATAGIPADEPSARTAAAAASPAGPIPAAATVAEPAALARPDLAPTAHPILSDLRVRRAIAHCTNKDALIAAAYPALPPAQRAALAMDTPILPTSWAYSPPATTYPYNPATGRALLDAAGWTLAPGAEYRTKGGKELYLTIIATDSGMRQALLTVFEAQMRNCGVHVLRYHRNATWVYGVGGLFGRNFELGEFGWVGEVAPDLLGLYGCDRVPNPANNWSGQNYMGWCNPAADAAATQANNTALTQAERKAFYATFTDLFAADLPSLILFRRDGSDVWEHIDFNLETYAQEAALGPAGTGAAPLVYSDYNDLPTTVAAPPGAVAGLIDLRYTPLVEGANPPPSWQTFVSVFRLAAVQGGVPAESYDLAGPVTVTVNYPDPALTGDFVEDTLALHVWDPGAQAWQPAVETCPPGQQYAALDTAQRTVTTNVCHFSEFALLAVHRPDLIFAINYSHDWVEGGYPPGHTVWMTVTNGSGAVKATAELVTGVIPWWDGNTGFSTGDSWRPQRPDIQPGDWVYGSVDNGKSAEARVGLITGAVDVEADSITGTVDAAWRMPGPLDVFCRGWGAPAGAPDKQDSVTPDGSDPYACAWDPNSEWDVEPGQDLAVSYNEPAGHEIIAVFREPTPRLRVEKWLESGEVGAGGNVVFTVQYRNEGDADAENVVITDTLEGLTYLGDTSGFPHTGGGGQVAWALGTVAPGDWVQFSVFAQVAVAAGERVTNTVEIVTSNPYEWSGDVAPGDTQLNIGKWPWTGDPAAGQDVVFHVNPCNNGGTGSTQVTITDTLPVTLTLKGWWSDAPGWAEVSRSAHQLVVTKPVLAGWRCEAVYVRATVSAAAQVGDPLSNTAAVYAANDATTDDNEATWQGNVGAPRTNLRVNKGWGHGRLVPGGDLHYWIDYHNDGNLPVGTFRITETLPVSTTFDSAWRHDAAGRHPLQPIQVGDGIVVWEFAGLDNGFGENFEVVLLADADAAPGTLLINTAEISPLPGEDNYEDNASTATETLFDHGPNLRVRKSGQWDDWGESTRRASYELRVENVGDEIVYGVTVTDTFPAGMTMDGGLDVSFWRN